MIVTIDGPAASGKSVTAFKLAQKLNALHLNSGLLFRALAYLLLDKAQYSEDSLSVVTQATVQNYTDMSKLAYHYNKQNGAAIVWKDKDITSFLKTDRIGQYASILACNKGVRTEMTKLQRIIAQNGLIVVEGRDAGSIVFPDADWKFYLTASLYERARRWQRMHKKQDYTTSLKTAWLQVFERDQRDRTRLLSPLVVPYGAVYFDNSLLTLDETVVRIACMIKKKI